MRHRILSQPNLLARLPQYSYPLHPCSRFIHTSYGTASFHLCIQRAVFSKIPPSKPQQRRASNIYDLPTEHYSTIMDKPPALSEGVAADPHSQPVKKRQVVSSFILKDPEPGTDEKPMIALFRRSDKVSTYR